MLKIRNIIFGIFALVILIKLIITPEVVEAFSQQNNSKIIFILKLFFGGILIGLFLSGIIGKYLSK